MGLDDAGIGIDLEQRLDTKDVARIFQQPALVLVAIANQAQVVAMAIICGGLSCAIHHLS